MNARIGNKNRETHGMSRTRLYRIWKSMRIRCMDKNAKCYENYGGRGISICKEWDDFQNFHKWEMDNGYDEIQILRKSQSNHGTGGVANDS